MGHLVRCISEDGSLFIMACDTSDVAEKAREIHQTSKVCTAALGRLLTAAAMMGAMLKGDNDSLTLKINGGGPAGSVIAVADSSCHVKGYVVNGNAELPLNNLGKLDVGGAVGRDGSLTVIKDLGLSEPYVGQAPIVSGEIAEDITSYFAVSEQTPTVCGLGVLVAQDKTVITAGGFLIQLLPSADDNTITKVENDIKDIKSVTSMLTDNLTPEEICRKVLPSFNLQKLDESFPVYRCDCSRERVEKALISLGKNELHDMAKEENTKVSCQFCNKTYSFSEKDILNLIKNS
ncbi:MAG: Hsp33 family molecular chaperone HslO [Clostridiales bacterium]|nr:Hsp33 family molecular chaperone HslO [Clostridiales bacterium]